MLKQMSPYIFQGNHLINHNIIIRSWKAKLQITQLPSGIKHQNNIQKEIYFIPIPQYLSNFPFIFLAIEAKR